MYLNEGVNTNRCRYAQVAKTTLQVAAFVNNYNAINPEYSYIIDLKDHTQADEVQEDWFYNPETNMFTPEGKISYLELIQEPPTPTELYQAANLLSQAEIIANQRQQDKVMAAILLEQVGGEANV